MLRHLLLFVALIGCSQPQSDTSQPPGDEFPPNPAVAEPEPKVDTTFMDSSYVETWRTGIAAQIEGRAAVPHPRDIWKHVANFKPDPILGDPKIWDAASIAQLRADLITDAPAPRADEALALEAQDKEWDAAQIWIALNRLDDAKRCSVELEKESEWKAVAMIAVHTGDIESLDHATKKMVGGEQISRTQSVATYAMECGKLDIAKHIATTHGWKISEILSLFNVRQLALKGDASILVELLDREVTAWEEGGWYLDPQVVADIAILGKTDKVKASEYAGRYLALASANVLIWTECGEGCYSTPVAGTLELYQLIRADQALRELYLARLRTAIDEMIPVASEEHTETTIAGIDPGSYTGWFSDMWGNGNEGTEGNLLASYLLRVRSMNDIEMTAFWVAMLDTLGGRETLELDRELERELGREFGRIQEALRTNIEAQTQRRDSGLPAIDLYPDTQAELDELMAPSLELLCQKLPAKCPAASVAEATPTSTEPTNCAFVNGSRPQVGGKYVVTCNGGVYLASGEYKGGGVFTFSAFTQHTP